LRRDVESRGGRCFKVKFEAIRGAPDRLVLLPGVRPFLVELKRPGEVPTEQQRNLHAELDSLGLPVVAFDGERVL